MTELDKCCKNCQHFTRDYNYDFSAEYLESFELGYCMLMPPQGGLVKMNDFMEDFGERNGKVSVPPMVADFRWCGQFQPVVEAEPKLVPPWKA